MAQASTDARTSATRRVGLGRRVASALIRRREASILLVLVGLVIYFSLRTDAFFGTDNARVIAEFSAPIAIIAAGQVMLLICGEIDLSVGMVYAFSSWIFYFGVTDWGLPIWLAVVVGLVSGSAVGLVNGLITVGVGVPSFITTLGMAFVLNGITLNISGAFPVQTPGGESFKRFFGYSPYVTVYWALGVIVVMTILLNRTRWGLHTVATGGNLVGASESGVNVRRVKVGNFALCSTLGALAGMLESTRIDTIQALQGGFPVMFYAVAAAVIGGTSLLGGSGTIIGAALGVLVLAVLNLGLHDPGDQRLHLRSRPRDRDHRLDGAQRDAGAHPAVGAPRELDVTETATSLPGEVPDAIRVENVSKSFGVVRALEDVSLHVRPGEVLGLIGDNGAGKSTLVKILTGFHKPDAGRIFVFGEEVQLKSVTHARSLGIDTVFQDLALVPGMTVYHNMFLNREVTRGIGPVRFLNNRVMKKRAREYLDDIGVQVPSIDAEVARMSGGSARRSPSPAPRTRTRGSSSSTSPLPRWAPARER